MHKTGNIKKIFFLFFAGVVYIPRYIEMCARASNDSVRLCVRVPGEIMYARAERYAYECVPTLLYRAYPSARSTDADIWLLVSNRLVVAEQPCDKLDTRSHDVSRP